MESSRDTQQPKTCKSCDQCRNRKVRCIMVPGEASKCTHCIKRGETCQFKNIKRKLRHPIRTEVNTQARPIPVPRSGIEQSQSLSSPVGSFTLTKDDAALFIDQLLGQQPGTAMLKDEHPILKQSGNYIPSSSLAFWSDSMISSLSKRIGNNKFRELVETIECKMQEHVSAQGAMLHGRITFQKPKALEVIPRAAAREYIDAYFKHIHGVYPFLDRAEFELMAFDQDLPQQLANNPPFSALYHAVLALGCQYHGGGSFEPGRGKAWNLFQVSLGLIADILVPRENLINLQALVAMSIFATNMCCLQIDEMLLMEAARMALGLRYHKSNNRTTDLAQQVSCQRTFWVIYYMEKQVCFRNHNTSIIADYDIGCPIPKSLDANFGDYDWFLTSIRFSHILSEAYMSLFSVSGSLKTRTQYHAALDHIQGLVERWRMSVPKNFRPGMPYMHHGSLSPSTRMVFIQTSYNYYALVIALDRLALHIEANESGRETVREEHKRRLMNTARAVIELTRYIDVDAYTPIFILGIMPLSAVFILFDFVIHNPTHPETRINLSLLDITGGHFSLLERASGGSLPTSYIAEFAYIARQYVMEQNEENVTSRQNSGNSTGLTEQRMDANSDFGLLSGILQPESEQQHDLTDLQQGYASGEGSMNIMNSLTAREEDEADGNPTTRLTQTYNCMDTLHYPWPDLAMPWAVSTGMSPRLDIRTFFGTGLSDVAMLAEDDGTGSVSINSGHD